MEYNLFIEEKKRICQTVKEEQPCLGLGYEPHIVDEMKVTRVEKRKESFDFLSFCSGIKGKAKVKTRFIGILKLFPLFFLCDTPNPGVSR